MNVAIGARKLAIAAALAVAFAGCAASDPTPPAHDIAKTWESPRRSARPVRRVLVPPFEDRSGYPSEAERVRTSLIAALAARSDMEFVTVAFHELRDEIPATVFDTGLVPRRALLAAARRWKTDAVLFGVLKRMRPFEPVAVGITAEIVGCDEGETIWSADAVFDSSLREVEEDVRNWHDTRLAATQSLEGWRLVLLSPSRFIDYASARIAERAP